MPLLCHMQETNAKCPADDAKIGLGLEVRSWEECSCPIVLANARLLASCGMSVSPGLLQMFPCAEVVV